MRVAAEEVDVQFCHGVQHFEPTGQRRRYLIDATASQLSRPRHHQRLIGARQYLDTPDWHYAHPLELPPDLGERLRMRVA